MRKHTTYPLMRRLGWLSAVAVIAMSGSFAGNAAANHTSSDVANGTFFHDHVGWLVEQGVAAGYPDGTFRTGDPISRGQMAYWLGNYNNGFEIVERTYTTSNMNEFLIAIAQCPNGKRAVAGGGYAATADVGITRSYASSTTNWQVGWETTDGSNLANGIDFTIYALCMPNPVAVG